MQAGKKLLSLVLAAVLLFALAAGALAAEAQPDAGEAAADEAADAQAPGEEAAVPAEPEEDDELDHLMDRDELDAMVKAFMADRGINGDNFSVAFRYTGNGETYCYNEDKFMPAASLYKLSLIMGLARKVASGELQQTDSVVGMGISYIEERALVYSDNEVSEALINYFGTFRDYRKMQAEIASFPEEDLPEDYFTSNNTSARFMLGVLQELYSHPEKYPNVIECLKAAEPGHYFRMTLDGQYDVAQKYGGGSGIFHTAGIIYTPTPILLVVMTDHIGNGEYAIANMAQLMADYAVTMDRRRDEILERRAEEERLAAEKAEAERLAAEKAEQERLAAEEAEAERLAAEEAERERLAAEEAERERLAAEAAAQATAASPEEARPLLYVTIALAAAAVGLVVGVVVRGLSRKRIYR